MDQRRQDGQRRHPMHNNSGGSHRSRSRRSQQGGNRSFGGGAGRNFESNGPEGVKVRGTALQICEKYLQLLRDAQTGGDRVLFESYQQILEHYYRVLEGVLGAQEAFLKFSQMCHRNSDEMGSLVSGGAQNPLPRSVAAPASAEEAPLPEAAGSFSSAVQPGEKGAPLSGSGSSGPQERSGGGRHASNRSTESEANVGSGGRAGSSFRTNHPSQNGSGVVDVFASSPSSDFSPKKESSSAAEKEEGGRLEDSGIPDFMRANLGADPVLEAQETDDASDDGSKNHDSADSIGKKDQRTTQPLTENPKDFPAPVHAGAPDASESSLELSVSPRPQRGRRKMTKTEKDLKEVDNSLDESENS